MVPRRSRLVAELQWHAAQCSRDDYGHPNPRDFDYVMEREGVGPRRQRAFRQLLIASSAEQSAIWNRRRKREEADRKAN